MGDEDDDLGAQIRRARQARPVAEQVARAELDARVFGGTAALQIGRYALLHRLAEGGSGTLYVAHDATLDRRVALKILEPRVDDDELDARLGEARAIARVNDAHVVTVYDAGLFTPLGSAAPAVFVAMELVDGVDLERWGREGHGWREITAAMRQAARGLAAAHAAGVVHGDVKPANLLIDGHGHVKAADFGLARLGGSRPAPEGGSPAYAAPERGRGVFDAACDQYAFAAAFAELLLGGRPSDHPARCSPEPGVAAQFWSTRLAGTAPRWLTRIVIRALAVDPRDRFADMDAVVAAIDGARRRRRRWFTVAVSATGVAAIALAWPRRGPEPCAVEAARARTLIDGEAPRVTAALLASQRPYAAATADVLARELDGWAGAWAATSEAACVRGSQGWAPWADVQRCLDRDLLRATSLLDALRTAAPEAVERGGELVIGLADPRACLTAPPGATDVVANPAWEQRFAEAEAAHAAALEARAAELVAGAIEAARHDDDPARLARALRLSAAIAIALGDPSAAERVIEDALVEAERAHDDALAAAVLVDFAAMVGARGELALARRLLRWAEVRTTGDDAEARWAEQSGMLWAQQGELTRAIEELDRARALTIASHGADDLRTANVDSELGNVLQQAGRYDDALVEHGRALTIRRAWLGPDHPRVGASLVNLGNVAASMRRRDEALAHYAEAERIYGAALSEGHPDRAALANNIAIVEFELGRWDAALARHREALDARRRAYGDDHPQVEASQLNVAAVLEAMGDRATAEAMVREVLAQRRRRFGDAHPEVAIVLNNLGSVTAKQGRTDESIAAHREALAIRRAAFGEDHPDTAASRLNLGDALARAGRLREGQQELAAGLAVLVRLGSAHDGQLLWRRLRLAEIDAALGDHGAARQQLRRVLDDATDAIDDSGAAQREAARAALLALDHAGSPQ